MSSMKTKAAKFHQDDIRVLETMADNAKCTVSEFINSCVGEVAESLGYAWVGKQSSWGDPLRFERAEIRARGMPPLADDD